jgi:hypothetical protein
MPMTKISVYLDDGRVFEYEVASPEKAREHSHAIALTGYRHTVDGTLEHYPPHRISKIKCSGGVDTSYPDRVRGT